MPVARARAVAHNTAEGLEAHLVLAAARAVKDNVHATNAATIITTTVAATLDELGKLPRTADITHLQDRLTPTLAQVLDQFDRLIAVHANIVMDTPDDQELHAGSVNTFRRYTTLARATLDRSAPTR